MNMRKHIFAILMPLFCLATTDCTAGQGVTLGECQDAAQANYPLIRKYGLIRKTASYSADNISKGWLPQVSAAAQSTLQNTVPELPEQLSSMMEQSGTSVKGLGKFQYRIGVDVSQTVYEGGVMCRQKELERLSADVEASRADVDLYSIRERVNELYFGILLLDERIRINREKQALLSSSLGRLRAMLRDGTAMECDVNSLEAELCKAVQDESELLSSRHEMLSVMSVFCGISIDDIVKPEPVTANGYGGKRPEMRLFDSQIRLADARESLLDAMLKPRVSAFVQGYYGYMGYDMFRDMFHRNPTFNGMVGIKVTWNIGGLYTRKNDKAKLQLQRQMVENSREVFLFNNMLGKIKSQEGVDKFRKLMDADGKIVSLLTKVRMSAESKLRHGIIDVNGLLQEITRENEACILRSVHEVQMLKEMYDMRFVTNE